MELSKYVITLFQELIASGKIHVSRRAASYFIKGIIIILVVQRPAVSREFVFKIQMRLVTPILCICRIRLHQRRSDKDSHPDSSYSFKRLEPCHVPVIARAA